MAEAVNVVDLLAERIRRAKASSIVPASFENDIKSTFKAVTGMDYADVKTVLHGSDKEFLLSAFDRGQSAKDFVNFAVEANGLSVMTPAADREDVLRHNDNRIAMLEFVDENRQDGWERGFAGSGYKEIRDGNGDLSSVAVMEPVNRGKDWGFGVKVYDVTALDHDGHFIAGTEPVKKFGGLDIEDAVMPLYNYETELNATASYGR
jgi:hypothetical protein